ncbi:MAG: hypothetical protein VX583_09305 [Bdellovibrionota bacterium]|nr:hypothetical protein [Pseudobdellovibrionaceae bacterium]|tara:strand:+ start:69646 stop:70071 length:426 start_codon:yes stop_codon:yes gene_type:complete
MSDVLVLPAVAKNVLYQCKKCDAERYHRVLAHTSETSAKIECEICGSKKTFKLTKPKSAAKKKTTASAKKRASKTVAPSTWAELNERANTDKAVDYNFKNTYEANTVLDHKKFGIGFIIKVEGQKMEVVFQDQIRQLIHGR